MRTMPVGISTRNWVDERTNVEKCPECAQLVREFYIIDDLAVECPFHLDEHENYDELADEMMRTLAIRDEEYWVRCLVCRDVFEQQDFDEHCRRCIDGQLKFF